MWTSADSVKHDAKSARDVAVVWIAIPQTDAHSIASAVAFTFGYCSTGPDCRFPMDVAHAIVTAHSVRLKLCDAHFGAGFGARTSLSIWARVSGTVITQLSTVAFVANECTSAVHSRESDV
jgi:hypothetical protein